MFQRIVIVSVLILLFGPEAIAQEADGNPGWWQGVDTPAFAGGAIREPYCDIISYIEGSFGGMLMAAAGVLAIGTAAFGNMKHGITAMAVGFAAFSMSTIVSLFFGQLCDGGALNGVDGNGQGVANIAREIAPDIDFEQTPEKQDPFDL